MRKILEDMKNEYESVRPSDGFRERVFDKMKKKRKKSANKKKRLENKR